MSAPVATTTEPTSAGSTVRTSGHVRLAGRNALRTIASGPVGRYVVNAAPIARYRSRGGTAAPAVVKISNLLKTDGVVLSSVAELLGDHELFDALQAQCSDLRARPDLGRDPAKPFLTELLGQQPELSPADPLVRLALHPLIRGVAESYAGMELGVQDVNIWVNAPSGAGPALSQRWHRDLPEDCDIVKCFIYLADVPDAAGPLQYVRRSNTASGRRAHLRSEFDGIGYRLDEADIVTRFGESRIVTARGPAGTLVFGDTRGIHRGGRAVDTERVVAQITYGSRASTRPRNLRPAASINPSQLSDFRLVG